MVVVPEQMGRINTRTVVECLRRFRRASRAELAKALGLSQPTVGKIADRLLEQDVIREVDGVNGWQARSGGEPALVRLGRPGRLLELDRVHPRFLGIQLGMIETSLAALPVGVDGEDDWQVRVPTPDSAAAWMKCLHKAAGQIKARDFTGVMVSVPGIVDEQNGGVLFSPNLHWTERADLGQLVKQVWNIPVLLVQEERALALGHQCVDPSGEDFLLVDFGEGVGGAVIIGGKLFTHPLPISGELGHTKIMGNLRPCGCGTVGCLETLVSIRGLLQSFAEANPRGGDSWTQLAKAIQTHGVQPWLAAAMDATAAVIGSALNVLGLRRVIITGSLGELPSSVVDYLSSAIVGSSMWARFGELVCEIAPRRRAAGLVAVGVDKLILPLVEAKVAERSVSRSFR
jgi:predicted NBD/HSP70 family sugar kinase